MKTLKIKCNKSEVLNLVEKTLKKDKSLIFKAFHATGERHVPTLITNVADMYWDTVMDSEGFDFDNLSKKVEVISIKGFINNLEVTC